MELGDVIGCGIGDDLMDNFNDPKKTLKYQFSFFPHWFSTNFTTMQKFCHKKENWLRISDQKSIGNEILYWEKTTQPAAMYVMPHYLGNFNTNYIVFKMLQFSIFFPNDKSSWKKLLNL
jgi:hypothetical protein